MRLIEILIGLVVNRPKEVSHRQPVRMPLVLVLIGLFRSPGSGRTKQKMKSTEGI